MSPFWRYSQAGGWIRTAGYILGRIMPNMNSSGNPWWACDARHFGFCTVDAPFDTARLMPDGAFKLSCFYWGAFISAGLFPGSHGFHIQWNKWDGGSFPAHTGIKVFLFIVHAVPMSWDWIKLHHLSSRHRASSTPAAVQRYTDTSMRRSKAGSLGKSFTFYCGGQAFISPTRELPRWEKPSESSHKCVLWSRGRRAGLLLSLY